MVNISQYTVVLLDDPRHPDAFQLTDDTRGKSYSVSSCPQIKTVQHIYLFTYLL